MSARVQRSGHPELDRRLHSSLAICAVARIRATRYHWTRHAASRVIARFASHQSVILGIDPGLRRTGWGVIDVDGNRLIFVACGSVETRETLAAGRTSGRDP